MIISRLIPEESAAKVQFLISTLMEKYTGAKEYSKAFFIRQIISVTSNDWFVNVPNFKKDKLKPKTMFISNEVIDNEFTFPDNVQELWINNCILDNVTIRSMNLKCLVLSNNYYIGTSSIDRSIIKKLYCDKYGKKFVANGTNIELDTKFIKVLRDSFSEISSIISKQFSAQFELVSISKKSIYHNIIKSIISSHPKRKATIDLQDVITSRDMYVFATNNAVITMDDIPIGNNDSVIYVMHKIISDYFSDTLYAITYVTKNELNNYLSLRAPKLKTRLKKLSHILMSRYTTDISTNYIIRNPVFRKSFRIFGLRLLDKQLYLNLDIKGHFFKFPKTPIPVLNVTRYNASSMSNRISYTDIINNDNAKLDVLKRLPAMYDQGKVNAVNKKYHEFADLVRRVHEAAI